MRLSKLALSVGCLLAMAGSAWGQRSLPAELAAPVGGPGDLRGGSVAMCADFMIVGVPNNDVSGATDRGSVSVYSWNSTAWVAVTDLVAADGTAGDLFGRDVAIFGDVAVVGAPGDANGRGAAYVFTRNGSAWVQTVKLTAADGAPTDFFGGAVDVHGDTIVVGAPGDQVGANADQGSVYVFAKVDGAWVQDGQYTGADGAALDQFGVSVALSADSFVAGAVGDDVGANTDQGSAYVFARSGAAWSQAVKLVQPSGQAGSQFGLSLDLAGDDLVVGAPAYDMGAVLDCGAVQSYRRVNGVWTSQLLHTAVDREAADGFGRDVALSGNTMIIGAENDSVGPFSHCGSAYLYVRSTEFFTPRDKLIHPLAATDDRFGGAVALWGDAAVVGAPGDDIGGFVNSGSAWTFTRTGTEWMHKDTEVRAAIGTGSESLGQTLDLSGDTLVAGTITGRVRIFEADGPVWRETFQINVPTGPAAAAIDGNTIIVGSPFEAGPQNFQEVGAAYVYVRSGGSWVQQARLIPSNGFLEDRFGYSVAIDGDTAVITAIGSDFGGTDSGAVYVFVRNGSVWTQQAEIVTNDLFEDEFFGESVSIDGDTIVVGAAGDDVGAAVDQGSAYVFFRVGASWTQQARLRGSDSAAFDQFGDAVVIDGNTVVVGAWRDDDPNIAGQGSAYVFTRQGTVWTEYQKIVAPDAGVGDGFGYSVALDAERMVVGARFADNGTNDSAGAAWAYRLIGASWTQVAKFGAADASAFDNLGAAVAVSGPTLIAGAPGDDDTASSGGSIYTFDWTANDIARVSNDMTGADFDTFTAALLPAQSGQQLTGTTRAFAEVTFLDTIGRSLGFFASGSVRTAPSSILNLGGSSSLVIPTGADAEFDGALSSTAFGSATLVTDRFTVGSRGSLNARTNSSFFIASTDATLMGSLRVEGAASMTLGTDHASLAGNVRLDVGATLAGTGTMHIMSNLSAAAQSSITAPYSVNLGGTASLAGMQITAPLVTSRGTTELTGGVSIFGATENYRALNIFGSSSMFGNFLNSANATTTIRSGTLFLFGSLTNNGTIVGTLCTNCLATPPNLEVGGDLVLGARANLAMPFLGSVVHVGGDFDCAVDSNSRFDLSLATLQIEGSDAVQTLEVMSRDIHDRTIGLNRAREGAFPIGTLEIGPADSVVRLVDARENDSLLAAPEALYVDHLVIHAGSRLINTNHRIYYNTLELDGVVDVPSNLIQIGTYCSADFNMDGGVDSDDVILFFALWDSGLFDADFNDDGGVDADDVILFFGRWDNGC